ncbi:MAG TPA: FAD-dependent oxidoreductase [Solirubrobacteraceae bacterium]|nr:FAD-dependent oxidoreductase [Solirubrobacteraceae bacterium]
MSTTASRASTDVIELHSAQDAVDAVRLARSEGRRVVVLSPRDAAPADADGALVVSTAALNGVEIDEDMWRARVEAGALWRDVSLPASELGLAPLAAQAGDSPVVPDTLHGGVSWLARLHGLACNSVTAVELVTPDGELVRADFATEPELFYALRGGGEQLGIVVAVELLLHPVAQLYAGSLMWPIERAPEILRRWRDWARTAPVELTSVARLLRTPDTDAVPAPFRGRAFVAIEAAYAGCAEAAEAFIDHLRHLQPEIDTFTTMPPAGLLALHGDPECGSGRRVGGHRLLGTLTDEAIDAVLEAAGPGAETPLDSVEIRQLGGAVAAEARYGGAAERVGAEFVAVAVGVAHEGDGEAMAAAAAGALGDLAPWDAGDPLSAPARARVREVKRRVDPDRMFAGVPRYVRS